MKYALILTVTETADNRAGSRYDASYFQLFQSDLSVEALGEKITDGLFAAVERYAATSGAMKFAKDDFASMKAKLDQLEGSVDLTSISAADFERMKSDMRAELKKIEDRQKKAVDAFDEACEPDHFIIEGARITPLSVHYDLNGKIGFSQPRWKVVPWDDFYDLLKKDRINRGCP